MTKYTFTSEFRRGGVSPLLGDSEISEPKLTMEFEADTYEEVLNNFTQFLRGCGFQFEGEVGIVNDSFTISDDTNCTKFHEDVEL